MGPCSRIPPPPGSGRASCHGPRGRRGRRRGGALNDAALAAAQHALPITETQQAGTWSHGRIRVASVHKLSKRDGSDALAILHEPEVGHGLTVHFIAALNLQATTGVGFAVQPVRVSLHDRPG